MLIGKGNTTGCLDYNDVRAIVVQGFQQVNAGNKRVLVIIPDTTRTAPIPTFFRAFYEVLRNPEAAPFDGKVAQLDYLVALGTHQALDDEAFNRLVGITVEERGTTYAKIGLFNHRWDDPDALAALG